MFRSSMHLNQLQALLEDLNEVHAPLRVTEVLLPPQHARLLRGGAIRDAAEQVFTWQDQDDEIQLGVYIDPRLQCRLALADPRLHLHDHNLPALLAASEGISHFLALSWAAGQTRQISALELELQGEIDKYVIASRLASAGEHSLDPATLFERMFEQCRFADDLQPEELSRYQTAHRAAARLLQEWLNRYHGDFAHPGLVAELRRFYRLPREAKLRRSGG